VQYRGANHKRRGGAPCQRLDFAGTAILAGAGSEGECENERTAALSPVQPWCCGDAQRSQKANLAAHQALNPSVKRTKAATPQPTSG